MTGLCHVWAPGTTYRITEIELNGCYVSNIDGHTRTDRRDVRVGSPYSDGRTVGTTWVGVVGYPTARGRTIDQGTTYSNQCQAVTIHVVLDE